MAVLRLNPQEFAKYHQKLAERLRPTLQRGVISGAARAIPYLVERTRTAPPANPAGKGTGGAVNTGAFVGGWRSLPLVDGAALINSKGYGPIVEHGRRVGAALPPYRAIVEWAKRRLGLSDEEAERAAYPIRAAIKKRGLIGRKILTAEAARNHIMMLVRLEVIHEIELELERKQ